MVCRRTVPHTGTWFSRGLYFCFLKTKVGVLAEVVNVCNVVESARPGGDFGSLLLEKGCYPRFPGAARPWN